MSDDIHAGRVTGDDNRATAGHARFPVAPPVLQRSDGYDKSLAIHDANLMADQWTRTMAHRRAHRGITR